MSNINRLLQEQFGDIQLPEEPEEIEAEVVRPLTAQEKILQDMGDVVMTDLTRDIMKSIKTVEVIDSHGREYKVKLKDNEVISYAIEGNNEVLRIYINS